MRIVRIAAVALFILAVAALAGVGRPEAVRSAEGDPADSSSPRTITVNGTATVTAVPDRATFSFGVDTRAETASAALAQSAQAGKRIVDAVKRAGIEGKDIQTQNVSLYPVTSDDGRQIEGYAANSSVTVRLGNLDRAGAVVDAAVSAGANSVSGPSLERSDADELQNRALVGAVADARTKAEALAEAADGSLGDVLTVTEGAGSVPPIPYAAAELAARDMNIEPGTQEIQASVTVTFELRS
jgi:uncharacterized protein YggE